MAAEKAAGMCSAAGRGVHWGFMNRCNRVTPKCAGGQNTSAQMMLRGHLCQAAHRQNTGWANLGNWSAGNLHKKVAHRKRRIFFQEMRLKKIAAAGAPPAGHWREGASAVPGWVKGGEAGLFRGDKVS